MHKQIHIQINISYYWGNSFKDGINVLLQADGIILKQCIYVVFSYKGICISKKRRGFNN